MTTPEGEDGGTRKDPSLDAMSRDFARYDQVEKRQNYRLAESERLEEFDESTSISTCDMARYLRGNERDRALFAEELGTALEEIGFAILEGHGVEPEVHARCFEEVERVFTQPTLDEKLAFRARRHGAVNQGYFPRAETSDIHPDQVEGWVFGRRAFQLGDGASSPLEQFWPNPMQELVFRRLFRAQEPLVLPLMRSILAYLGCEPALFDERLRAPSFAVRLNYYPPLEDPEDPKAHGDQGDHGDPERSGRLLGHEDTDLFTLLPAPRIEGLQVLNRRNFRWIRLEAPPGTIILNTGDYMQRITNDRLPSTTHRVSRPRDPELASQSRVSFPMNVYLREEELLECLPGLGPAKYEPVTALRFHTRTTAKYYGDDYADLDLDADGAPSSES